MNKINYDIEMEHEINLIKNNKTKPKLLLHACCAPCSSAVIEILIQYFNITIYFYNPNITDSKEYQKRLDEIINFAKNKFNLDVISALYSPQTDFFPYVKGLENIKEGGKRCFVCYRLRLENTAMYAKHNNYDYFATVLTISPLKNASKINEIGADIAQKYNIPFLFGDFKKKNRYLRSLQISKEYNLYRQNYCGCIFSQNKT